MAQLNPPQIAAILQRWQVLCSAGWAASRCRSPGYHFLNAASGSYPTAFGFTGLVLTSLRLFASFLHVWMTVPGKYFGRIRTHDLW